MWFILALLVVLMPLCAPLVLTRAPWQLRYPRLALTAWLSAYLGGIGAGVALLVWTVARAAAADGGAPPARSVAFTVAAWGALAALGAVASLVLARAEPLMFVQHHNLHTIAPLASSREQWGRTTIISFDSPEATAFTGSPLSREVYVSNALRAALPAHQLNAVIVHEMMHLRYWHGVIVRLAEINAACLPPMLRAGREFKRSALLLVELIADDAAARRVGPASYANALVSVGELAGDDAFELRARRMEHRNWRPSLLQSAWRLLRA